MSGIFGGGKKKSSPAPVIKKVAPKPDPEEVNKGRDKEAERRRRAMVASTMLSSEGGKRTTLG